MGVQRSVTPVQKRQIISTQDDDIQEVVQVPVKSEPVDHVVAQPPPVQPKYYTPQPPKVSAPSQSSYSASTTNQQLDTFNPPNTELASYSTEVYDDQQDESYDDCLEEENTHHCQICGKYYKSKGSLATHVSLS